MVLNLVLNDWLSRTILILLGRSSFLTLSPENAITLYLPLPSSTGHRVYAGTTSTLAQSNVVVYGDPTNYTVHLCDDFIGRWVAWRNTSWITSSQLRSIRIHLVTPLQSKIFSGTSSGFYYPSYGMNLRLVISLLTYYCTQINLISNACATLCEMIVHETKTKDKESYQPNLLLQKQEIYPMRILPAIILWMVSVGSYIIVLSQIWTRIGFHPRRDFTIDVLPQNEFYA